VQRWQGGKWLDAIAGMEYLRAGGTVSLFVPAESEGLMTIILRYIVIVLSLVTFTAHANNMTADANHSRSSITDAEVIEKAENCQMTTMTIEEASNLLVRIHRITSSIGDNDTIKVGANEYAGFQIKTYEEWLSSKLQSLENAKLVADQRAELPKASGAVSAGAVASTALKSPVVTSVNPPASRLEVDAQDQSPMAAVMMLMITVIGSTVAFRSTSSKPASLRRWTALVVAVPGYALFFGSSAYVATAVGEMCAAIGCGMIMTGFILLVPDIYKWFARICSQMQEQQGLREQRRVELLNEMTPYEREMFLLREKEVTQQTKATEDAKRERRGDRFAAAIVSGIALHRQGKMVEAQKEANRLQEEQNRLLRERANKK
jgi:hypothetical protein